FWLIGFFFRPVYADFDSLESGARPLGLGNAFTGLADDANAITYNPAGLGFQRRASFSADYGRPILGLDDKSILSTEFVGFLKPLSKQKTKQESLEEIKPLENPPEDESTNFDPDAYLSTIEMEKDLGVLGFGAVTRTLSGAVSENVFSASYAKTLLTRWSAGL